MRERIEITQALFLPLYNLCTIIVYIKPTKYIMRNTGLEEAQAGIKIAERKSVTSDMQMTPPLWQKVKRN